uniref:Uncharacterized protein n=1 Tax=Sphaerodactylus townsendi TaxID=933632 RepID=A0ACB8ET86_9SAUR
MVILVCTQKGPAISYSYSCSIPQIQDSNHFEYETTSFAQDPTLFRGLRSQLNNQSILTRGLVMCLMTLPRSVVANLWHSSCYGLQFPSVPASMANWQGLMGVIHNSR